MMPTPGPEFGPPPLGSAIAVLAVACAVTGARAAAATTRNVAATPRASDEMKRDMMLLLCVVVEDTARDFRDMGPDGVG